MFGYVLIENSGQRYALETAILQNVKYLHTANWKEFYTVGKRHCSFLLPCVSFSKKTGKKFVDSHFFSFDVL